MDDFDEQAMLEQWKDLTADNGPEETEPVAEKTDTRERDESGKFVVKAKEEKTEPVAEVSAEIEKVAEVTETTETAPVVAGREMPATWKPELAQHWGTLPEAVQAEILRREDNQRKGIGQYKQGAEAYQRFTELTRPYEANLRQFGVTAEVAAGELFKADHALRYGSPQQKVQIARQMLQDYGIDPTALLGEEGQQPQVDPHIYQLQ